MKIKKAYSKEYLEFVDSSMSIKEKKRIVKKINEYMYFRLEFLLVILVISFILLGFFCLGGLLKILFMIAFPILFIFIGLKIIIDGELFQYDPIERVCFSIDKLNSIHKNNYLYFTNISPMYYIGEFKFSDTIILNDQRKILLGKESLIIEDKNYKSSEILFNKIKSISILTKEEILSVKQRKLAKLYNDNIVLSIKTESNEFNIVFKNNPNVGLVEINHIAKSVLEELSIVIFKNN